jgi:Txe/YoeB family toxin of Txe-Axe toxin-antitoxin module
VYRHGLDKVREFPAFHEEKLKGKYVDERSSRLNIQYRLIYRVDKNVTTVCSLKITPHKY